MATTLIVSHTVRDYDTWRPGFDDHGAVRREHGSTGERVYRAADAPNDLLVVVEFPSAEAALGFMQDPSLKTVMDKFGVISEPSIVIGETLAHQPA